MQFISPIFSLFELSSSSSFEFEEMAIMTIISIIIIRRTASIIPNDFLFFHIGVSSFFNPIKFEFIS